jgi:ankyrin repeat protein
MIVNEDVTFKERSILDLFEDVTSFIFSLLKLTDKIQFSRVCSSYHLITKDTLKLSIEKFEQVAEYHIFEDISKCLVLKYYDGYVKDINILKIKCSYLAYFGHLDILKWARKNGSEWDRFVCFYAALNGHLEVLKWARENGCEWDSQVCYHAALNGHLEVLKWAKENGCE